MRTTLNLADDVVDRAKHLAIERRTTLTALIEEALEDFLEREAAPDGLELPELDGGGFPKGYPFDGSEGKILAFLETLNASA